MTVAPTHRMLQRIRERYNRRTHGGKYEPDSRDNDIAHLLVEVDRLLAALLSSDRAVQPEADDEPLHTGDDERLDLLTQIIGDAESALDDPDPALDMGAVVNGILGDAQKLDALLVETIKRERAASSDRAVKEPAWQPIEAAPKDTALLLWTGWSYQLGHFNTSLKRWAAGWDNRPIEATHWMWLPAAPTREKLMGLTDYYGCVACQQYHHRGEALFDEHIMRQDKHGIRRLPQSCVATEGLVSSPASQHDRRLRKLIRDWRMRAEKQAPDYASAIPDCCREEIQGCASELEDELEGR